MRFLTSFLLLVFLARIAAAATTQPATTQSPGTVSLQPVPLLSPEDEASTFRLPPGFRAEVVAAEPMVEHPVHIAFDPDGRLWVAEMRSYMPDVDGWREEKPTGRISVLEDTDRDGRMDKATVFLDKLVLPRAVGFAGDGILVCAPPNLLFCRDTNHDLVADETKVLLTDAGIVSNPENSFNGLLYNLDNWIYNTSYTQRIRHKVNVGGGAGDTRFEFSSIPDLGQFGIARDDYGRLFFNTNSDHLRASLVPPHYSSRNPDSPASIADTRIAADQTVWPIHAATVNRGYRPGFLRPDGTLEKFTAACGPVIYRAGLFPAEYYGNAFTCEATSNLVHRSILAESDAKLTATSAYKDHEFLASAYERFRPVNLTVGPDGALYVVDMHHGIIQHKMSITPYAAQQYKAKTLTKHLRTGRIFRIVPEQGASRDRPELSNATSRQLILQLTHANGWFRDTSQRLLVERNDPATIAPLRQLASVGELPVHRLHALWTLEGMDQLDKPTLLKALADPDSKVRANAVRLSEKMPAPEVMTLKDDKNADVRLQFLLTITPLATAESDDAIANILRESGDNHMYREAVVSGLAGRELAFLRRLIDDPAWSTASESRHDSITDIARSITRRYQAKEMLDLAELIGTQPAEREWITFALLEAIPKVKMDDLGAPRPLDVRRRPVTLDRLATSQNLRIQSRAAALAALFQWPGKPAPQRPPPAPLTPRQQELFALGKTVFAQTCAQCHQPDGRGAEAKAPPLVNSPWALGPEKRIIRIVLHGVRGPISVGDKTFNLDMPALGSLNDDQIAGVLTFIRRSWDHEAAAVNPQSVQSIRDLTQSKKDGWTEAELLQIR